MSYANSRIPSSAQQGIHENLDNLVRKHRTTDFRKPYAPCNLRVMEIALADWDGKMPVILDAGCGVGHSTIQLARSYPDHWVIGADRSQDRLERRKPYPDALLPTNMMFVQTDLVDFWRLLEDAGVRLARHYLLYPNPWPKIGHLTRRWHAHPVFPHLLQLGGILECRSNWQIYIEEFSTALGLMLDRPVGWETYTASLPLTPFERKYRDSGQTLYRTVVSLDR